MPERLAAVHEDHRHVIGEAPLKIRIGVDVDLRELERRPRRLDRALRLIA